MAMQVKGQSNGCVFTELLTYFHVAVVFLCQKWNIPSFCSQMLPTYEFKDTYLEGMTQKQE